MFEESAGLLIGAELLSKTVKDRVPFGVCLQGIGSILKEQINVCKGMFSQRVVKGRVTGLVRLVNEAGVLSDDSLECVGKVYLILDLRYVMKNGFAILVLSGGIGATVYEVLDRKSVV